MWCCFTKGGFIVTSVDLPALSDEDAVEQSKLMFQQADGAYDAFEVWAPGRMVYRSPPPKSEIRVAVWPEREE